MEKERRFPEIEKAGRPLIERLREFVRKVLRLAKG